MKRLLICSAAMVAMFGAMPALAQDQDPENEIIVEGERIDRGEARDQARDITRRSSGSGDPLARFQQPVCPGVWGLSPENAQHVIDRIYDNAERAGVEIDATPNCNANMWVIFVDDPQATFAELRRENSFMVRNLSTHDREQAERERGPAVAWNLVSTRNREGEVISVGNVDPGEIPSNSVTLMSRLNSAARMDIDVSVVLIQRSALGSLDAYAVADYATMRALARTSEPDDDGAFDSILTLFEDGNVDRLSEFDLAYLQDLYSSRATQPGRQSHGRVAALMERGQIAEE